MGTSVSPWLVAAPFAVEPAPYLRDLGRGSHSSTFRLNFSAFYGIGVHLGVAYWVFRGCQGVLGDVMGCSGCILCRKQLRFS
jgi:hypothetical protein